MEAMAILNDTSKCSGCRACQVACKNWNQLKGEKTVNWGSHENPADLSSHTWNRVRASEIQMPQGRFKWPFFSERCRHCEEAPCVLVAEDAAPGAIVKDITGAVIFTEKTASLPFDDIRDACPFNIPRQDKATGRLYKCTLCIDRITAGLKPACVSTCSTGALLFGTKTEMLKLAYKRIEELGGDASLYPGEEYSTLWVLKDKEEYYKLAKAPTPGPRHFAWKQRFGSWGPLGLAAAIVGLVKSDPRNHHSGKM